MIRITDNTDIKSMTTFGLKAECGRLIEYDTVADLQQLYAAGELRNLLPLGGGSNLLFTTGRFSGTVLHCTSTAVDIATPAPDGTCLLTAAAGCTLDDLCRIACDRNLWGLENLSGIPGEIGGAAVQNVGAYGTEFKDVAETVNCFDIVSGEAVALSAHECRYGYRDSAFKHKPASGRLIVTSAILRLSTAPTPRLGYAALANKFAGKAPEELTPAMLREAVTSLRDGKLPDPAKVGSAGSFFKNPVVSAETYRKMQSESDLPVPGHELASGEVKLSAAWLIDHAGCKSFTSGGAAVWQSQPLVIVNATGNATGADVTALENRITEAVAQRFGVTLTPEVIHI